MFQAEEDMNGGAMAQQEGGVTGPEAFNRQIKELEMSEKKLGDTFNKCMATDAALRNRIKELEQSEKNLLDTAEQLNSDMHFLRNINLRIKGRLHDLQEALQEVSQEKEKSERAYKEKGRRLQDHLKMKEGEIKSYLEYFEHYKSKRRQQLRLLREREHHLQAQVLKLEKELVDHNRVSSLLITESEVISEPSPLQSRVANIRATDEAHRQSTDGEEDQLKFRTLTEDGEDHLKSQIQRLQHDLTTVLAREEVNNGEKQELVHLLQQSEDNEDFLNRKMEEFRCRISELKLSEFNLQQRVEDLEEENLNLRNELKLNCQNKAEEIPLKDAEGCRRQHGANDNLIKIPGTKSCAQDELSILLNFTFNHLKHGKELLTSLKNANADSPYEKPIKQPKKECVTQNNIKHVPVDLKYSYQQDIERSNTPPGKPEIYDFLNKADCVIYSSTSVNSNTCKTVVANYIDTSINTTSKPWIQTNPLLQSDSDGIYTAPLKDSIQNLELEIVKLHAENREQKKLLQANDELLRTTSRQKYHLKTGLQEANQLLYTWALRNKQVWREGTSESDQRSIPVHEELSNYSNQTTVLRNDQYMKNDFFFQEMYEPENGMTDISQDISSANESGFASSISSISIDQGILLSNMDQGILLSNMDQGILLSNMDQGLLLVNLDFESDASQFIDSKNLDKEAETECRKQEMTRSSVKEHPRACDWTKEKRYHWCHIANTVETELQSEQQQNTNVHIYEGNDIMRKLTVMEEPSVCLREEQTVEQINVEDISKRTLDEESDVFLLEISRLEQQLGRYSQQVSALDQEQEFEQQKIDSHDESYPKYRQLEAPVNTTPRIYAIEKEMESISEKLENLEQAKQNYLQKVNSLEQTHSKAIEELSELTGEKQAFVEKVSALEKAVENYEQKVRQLDGDNKSNSYLIASLNEQLSTIPLIQKEKSTYFEKASTLEKENYEFSQKIYKLQKENEKCSEKICSLEEEKGRQLTTSCRLEELNNAFSQRVSELEGDIATYCKKICRIEHENIMFYEKFHTLEEDIDRYYQRMFVSYETHSECRPMLSKSTLGKLTAKHLTKTDLPTIIQNIHTTCKMCVGENTTSKHTVPDSDRENNDNMEKSETELQIEGFSPENKFQKIFLIEEKKLEFFQLMSDLAEERDTYSQQISELLQGKDMADKKLQNMEEEKTRSTKNKNELETEEETLLKMVESLHTEKEEHLKEISKLQEGKEKCSQELAEERKVNTSLRKKICRLRQKVTGKIQTSKEIADSVILENKDLKELILDLKNTYENVMKDTMTGMEEMVRGLETENEGLLDRIHQMETDAALEVNAHVEQMLKEQEQLINRVEELETEARARKNENQSTQQPNSNTVTMKNYFIVHEDAIGEQGTMINTKNRKLVIDSKMAVADFGMNKYVVVNQLQGIAKTQGSSQQGHLDNDRSRENTLHKVSESPAPCLMNMEQQQTQTLARLASLVQECQHRNGLITQLVRALQRLTNDGEAGDVLTGTELAQTTGRGPSPRAEEVSSEASSDSALRMNAHSAPTMPPIRHHPSQQPLLNNFKAQSLEGSACANQPCCRGQTTTLEVEGDPQGVSLLQDKRCKNSFVNNTMLVGTEAAGLVSAMPAASHLPDVLASASMEGQTTVVEIPTVVETLVASRIKQEPPAAVESVCIIKAVGKCNLLIGWQRPLVDELGRSNGIFIKGYRIYVDGQFHKCIMSSACTKTVLENLDLSVPFEVSVQTIGINGLVSEKVHDNYNGCWSTNKDLSSSRSSFLQRRSTI